MAKFDFDKPVASFSWYLQNGSADDKRGNRLHVGTGQKAQIYFDPESGEFIGKLKYVDDYIDLADGAKQHFELPRTAREYKPSDFSPKFPISNVKFEVDESSRVLRPLPERLGGCSRHGSRMPRGTFRVGEDAFPLRQYVSRRVDVAVVVRTARRAVPRPHRQR